jgi:hypothetical protein
MGEAEVAFEAWYRALHPRLLASLIDGATVTTFAGRLLYSPDGVHWSSVALDALLDFTANVPYIAVGDRSAILGAGLRAPGVQPQRFWLVTRRR